MSLKSGSAANATDVVLASRLLRVAVEMIQDACGIVQVRMTSSFRVFERALYNGRRDSGDAIRETSSSDTRQ